MTKNLILASVAALALVACGRDDGETANDMAFDNLATGEAASGATNAAAPRVSTGQEYAAMASASDMFEIESARLAIEKSQNAGVKELARMLIADHEKSTADLKTAAGKAQPAITVTPQMDAEQQGNVQALRSANGAQFDQAWLQQQVAAHEKALALVQGYAQGGDVASLKQHATMVAGPIQRHLERARQLETQPAT
jgi:putative membrane protein